MEGKKLLEYYQDLKFQLGEEIRETMSANNNYINIKRLFGIDKSTSKDWLLKDINDPNNVYKKLIITYLKMCDLVKTFKLHKQLELKNPEEKTTIKDISIFFEMSQKEIDKFLTSKIKWKSKLLDYFQKINRYFLLKQINIVRKKIGLKLIDYNQFLLKEEK